MTDNTPQIERGALAQPLRQESSGISILDLLLILLERKGLLIIGLVIVSLSAVAYTLISTSYYTATSVILPSKQGMGSSIGSLLNDSPIGGLLKGSSLFGNQDDNTRFLSILDSRRLADILIERYDLGARYGFKKKRTYYQENVIKEFHKNVIVEEDKLENISIAVTDSNPVFAATLANDIVNVLDSLAYDVNRESARGSRIFFEQRLAGIRKDLDTVHQALAAFQKANNFIDLEQQVKASIDALANLEVEGIAADMEGQMLSSSFGNNSKLTESKQRKRVIAKQLDNYMNNGSGSLVLPLKKAPDLGIQYAYLLRDVKVQETLYAFVLQMYEQAKFREANNSPAVTRLEIAKVPQKRARPKRAVFCLLAFFTGFTVLSIGILLEKWVTEQRRMHTETYRKLVAVKSHFRFKK